MFCFPVADPATYIRVVSRKCRNMLRRRVGRFRDLVVSSSIDWRAHLIKTLSTFCSRLRWHCSSRIHYSNTVEENSQTHTQHTGTIVPNFQEFRVVLGNTGNHSIRIGKYMYYQLLHFIFSSFLYKKLSILFLTLSAFLMTLFWNKAKQQFQTNPWSQSVFIREELRSFT